MHVTGIIAEYNPFHKGHLCQLEMLKAAEPEPHVIALMSGSFTQRGEAALLDKWTRARLAVLNGCDLVLELPAVYALRSAEAFAGGGVKLLSRLGIADALAFGSELFDEKALSDAAAAMDSDEVQALLHDDLQKGHSYAASLCHALSRFTGLEEQLLRQPNTILALEYLRALRRENASPPIRPIPLPRKGAGHHEPLLKEELSSGRALRRALGKDMPDWDAIGRSVPSSVLKRLQLSRQQDLPDMEQLFRPLMNRVLTLDETSFQRIYGVNEGLEHRLLNTLQETGSLKDLIEKAAGRRYPESRIRRLLMHILLGFTKELAEAADSSGPLYARVLALNGRGRLLLREIGKNSDFPIITKVTPYLNRQTLLLPPEERTPLQNQLAMDFRATCLRGLTLSPPETVLQDFVSSPVYCETGTAQTS